jgi:hypothetical protein
MSMKRRSLLALASMIVATLTGAAQQPPSAPRATAPSPTMVSAILVDVVVRDRKGEPVAGLTAEDFEVRRWGP